MSYSFDAFSQSDSTNVYLKALKVHLVDKEEIYKMNPKLKNLNEIYIEKDSYSTNGIPENVNGKKVYVVTRDEILKLNKEGKLKSLIAIRPVTWKKESLRISVIEFLVISKRKKLYYTNLGGEEFEINGFTLKRVDNVHGNYD